MEISLERGGYWKYELFYSNYGYALHKVGKHEEENEIYKIGLSFFPNSHDILYNQAVCSLSLNRISEADEYIAKYRLIAKELGYPEYIERNLGLIFQDANIKDKAEEHFRKAFKLDPLSTDRIYWLARFLINNDINVDEGMELIRKGLEIQPDNTGLLGIKGWGYYKQGKYEEAILLLKKAQESGGFDPELYQHIQEVEQALANKDK